MIPPELLDLVKSGGASLAPVFAFMWWLERTDKLKAESKSDQLAERSLTAMLEVKALMQTIVDIFNRRAP